MEDEKIKEMENTVFATVILRSRTGKSLFESAGQKHRDTREFRPLPETFFDATREFEKMGFKIVSEGKFSLTIVAPRKKFEEVFRVRLKQEEQPLFREKETPMTRYYVTDEEINIPEEIADLVEKITLPKPARLLQSANAPNPSYHHLDVPGMISSLIKATAPHSHGFTGKNINVVMIDTGFYTHPYYKNKGYSITLNSLFGDPNHDYIGHGTAIAANLLAVAPDINFTMVKFAELFGFFVLSFPLAGFQTARNLHPDIITCSWGTNFDAALEAEIEDAVNVDGIAVVFACGNQGSVEWPGEMPDVISVGGAYIDDSHINWQASSYASSGQSSTYDKRIVPDVCGIVGQAPEGILIVMPTEPNCYFEQIFGGGSFPNKDETKKDDGWVVASGTSSAAPMVAGTVALMLQKNSNLSPNTIKAILMVTARDIITGQSASGAIATVGYDYATGYGLIDAQEALDACFIATAAYGSKLAPEVQFLRSFRNAWIGSSGVGKVLVDKIEQLYYKHSPPIAKAMRHDMRIKRIIRHFIVTPIVKLLHFGVNITNRRFQSGKITYNRGED
ncbi:MAG: S8 family serine peptidase [Candidatus Odinarchaeota archaeon]